MKIDIDKVSVKLPQTISQALEKLNKSETGIIIVIDDEKKVIGTITDGDIRRSFINGMTINDSIELIINKKPILAPAKMSKESRSDLMMINKIRHLPIIDEANRLIELEWQNMDGIAINGNNKVAMIMAGGEGMRLRPLTEDMPKPMLLIAGKPILQIIIESLRKVGFKKFILNVRYLSHKIEEYFQDGSKFGVEIHYVHETKTMGTAGSLGLLPEELIPESPFLVINGDLITTLNYKVFRDFHIAANYDFTICGRPYEVKIPFGYPKIEGDLVTSFEEKPTFYHLVNSGIYCLSPEIIKEVPKNEYMDMPDVIRKILNKGKRVGVFPLREKFHEIGRVETYEKAEDFYIKNIGN